ncbi:MAG TPA: hypothetical protein VFE57_13780, partial [Cyclobacteriaceae bacterium]|nr:hypothetical protein [Cyclobacteriaceae bacterium]
MIKINLSIVDRGPFNFRLSIFRFILLILFTITAFPALCQVNASSAKNRKLILRDEGLSQLSYVDLAKPSNNWYVPIPAGRDLQLVGNGRVLIGTGTGYEEHEILTGKKVAELTTFEGTIAATRLRNGNTLLTGLNWEGKKGIVLAEVDATGKTKRLINFPEFPYVRLVRETVGGTFIITSDTIVFEGDANGKIVWRSKFVNTTKPNRVSMHAWQALRLENGNTVS